MNIKFIGLLVVAVLAVILPAPAEERFATLKVGSEVYSNVTVTTVTATDIYFSHAKGMGNAKLKNLSPELQKQFRFDAAKSSAAEKAQAQANAQYLQHAATNRVAALKSSDGSEQVPAPKLDENGELVAEKLFATAYRGQRPPATYVEQWLTSQPDVTGKFALVNFWTTECAPCLTSIPHLNALQSLFRDKLVVIGLSNESVETMMKMTEPKVYYSVGTDPQARTMKAMQVRAIPHSILMDPEGIVRYEGPPIFLDAKYLEGLMTKYTK